MVLPALQQDAALQKDRGNPAPYWEGAQMEENS